MLRCFGAGRVISSAAERCVATVRPFAALTGGEDRDRAAVHRRARWPPPTRSRCGRPGWPPISGPAVVCVHRENLPMLLAAACARLGSSPPAGAAAAQGRLLGPARGRRRAGRHRAPHRHRLTRPGRLARASSPGGRAGVQSRVGGSEPSRISSQRLTSGPAPPLNPPRPSLATTRWQGTITGIGFEPMIWPTARAGITSSPTSRPGPGGQRPVGHRLAVPHVLIEQAQHLALGRAEAAPVQRQVELLALAAEVLGQLPGRRRGGVVPRRPRAPRRAAGRTAPAPRRRLRSRPRPARPGC